MDVNTTYMVFDIVGPNGYVPYVYHNQTLGKVLENELKNPHNTNYFKEIPKISSNELLHKFEYKMDDTYLIPFDWCLKLTPKEDILTPEFLKFINDKHNFFIIYVKYNYEISEMYSLI